MSLSVTNKNSPKYKNVNNVYDGVKNILVETHKAVSESHNYFQAGLNDELANFISKQIEKPLDFMADVIDSQMKDVREGLENAIVSRLFIDNKNSINKVYRSNDAGNLLHYYIILKNDSLKNRRVFLSFLNDYNKEKLSQRFPILFDFTSAKNEGAINKVKEISLKNATAPKQSQAQ
jgi:hypothetical protein